MISPQELQAMTAHERERYFAEHPAEHAIIQALARAAFKTDVDATGDAISEKLDALGVTARERNALLANIAEAGQHAFPKRNPDADPREVMRLLDLMWVGALVHEYFERLFPGVKR